MLEGSAGAGNAQLRVLNPLVGERLCAGLAGYVLPMQGATVSTTCGVSSFGFVRESASSVDDAPLGSEELGPGEEDGAAAAAPAVDEDAGTDDGKFVDELVYQSDDGRFGLFPPHQSRDQAMFELLNDEETMLPWLSECKLEKLRN